MRVTIDAKDSIRNISMKSFNYDLHVEHEINKFVNKLEHYFNLGFDVIEIERGN